MSDSPFGPAPSVPTPAPGEACAGFAWLGQSFAYCDRCARPFWEHTHEDRLRDGVWVQEPITPEDAAACRRKWGSDARP
ncbi:hypothetical protein [Nocardia sp. NPDC057227]|uniref:hypothetical protein n=1 Tax=Nocardia sp. NPDC057227 TaxID=3346056 RepID=UPI003645936E